MSTKFALEIEGLTKSIQIDFYKKPQQVLKKINLTVREGCFTGLIGPNGAGKTTTVKCVMNFIFPDQGKIKYFGSDNAEAAKQKIGFLPERPYFQEFLTGLEFLKVQWDLSHTKHIKKNFNEKAEDVLALVKLSHAAHKKLSTYSKGMLQRIGIAQALIAEPKFLILDEPMSGLDPDGRILIKDILKDLKQQGLTVLMSSHLLEDIEELCEDLIIIHQGETFFNGLTFDFQKSYRTLEDAYRALKVSLAEDLNV